LRKKADNIDLIIDELVELNRSLITPGQVLARLVSQIKASGEDCAKTFSAFYAKVKGNCQAGNNYLASFTKKLGGDLVGVQAARNRAADRVKKNTAAAAKLKTSLHAAKENLAEAHKRQEKEAEVYRHALLEAHSKIVVIRHIRNIVVDELLNGSGASLIQVNTITGKLKELKGLSEKDNDSMLNTVVIALLDMTSEKNLNDQGILRKFIAALDKLRDSIKKWRKSYKAHQKNLRRIHKANNEAKLKSIRALGRLLVEAQSAVIGGNRAIEELTNAEGLIKHAIVRKGKESKHWKQLCDDQDRVANIFIAAYDHLKAKVQAVAKVVFQA